MTPDTPLSPPSRARRRTGALAALAALCLAGPALLSAEPAAEAPAAPLEIVLEPSAAVVTGLSSGGETLLFSIAREPLGYHSRVSRRDEVLAADETGAARLDLVGEDGEPVELQVRSMWVAVDLATGAMATAAGDGFDAPRRGLPAGALRWGPSQRLDRIADRLESAQVVLVRPGAVGARGIWGLSVMDGSHFDEDGMDDGGLEAALDRMVPLADSGPPPEELLTGDVLVVVDPSSLAYFATRLTL